MLRRFAGPLLAAAMVAGCATAASDPAQPAVVAARVAPAPELQPFYSQQLDWQKCGPGRQCATLTVPLDYSNPEGRTLQVSVLRNLATGPSPQGSLVVNPGGPGGSGVDYAARAASAVSPALRSAYTIVGFDPRGVKRSDPVECLTDPQRDNLLAQDSSPNNPGERADMAADADVLATGCETDDAELLNHLGSRNVAADMDVLRSALEEEQLNYLGFSYGTYLGAMYAEAYPQRVGRMVLDGGIDPALSNTDISLGQALGFELALQRYLADCVGTGECPLGDTTDEAYATLQQFLDELDVEALPTGDPVRPLTQGLALNAVVYPLYSPEYGWPLLTAQLRRALMGDGAGLLEIVDLFTRRNADGSYDDNGLEMLYAVNCVDRPDRPDLAAIEQLARQWQEQAPIFGAPLAYSNVACERWPASADDLLGPLAVAGVPPVLIIGTEFDPATPYEWSVSLADQFVDGRLVTWRGGDGHTAYRSGSTCIDAVINAYLISGEVPTDGTECAD